MRSVWIINEYAYSKKDSGGTRHFNLANNLAKHNIDTFVIAGSLVHNTREQRIKSEKNFLIEKIENVNFLWIRLNNLSGIYIPKRIFLMLQFFLKVIFFKNVNYLQKPDIIIGSSPTLLSALAAYILSKRYKAKFVYEVRDLWLLSLEEIGFLKKNNLFYILIDFIDNFLARNSHKLIILFKGAKKYYMKKGIKSNKFLFIPNGTNYIPYTKNKPNFKDNKFKIFYLGAHGKFNDLFNIIKAFKIIQDNQLSSNINLYLYGEGNQKNDLIKFVKDQNLKNIFFNKAINRDELILKAKDADAFIFSLINRPNLYKYGLSFNKIYEYMIMSRPIVFTTCTNQLPREKEKLGLFTDSDNPKKLALEIIKLSNLPLHEREKISLDNYEFVCRNNIYSLLSEKLAKGLFDNQNLS